MSNKIPCGGFYLDNMLNVNDNGELSINGGTPYQQLVTDGNGNAKWENKPYFIVNVVDSSDNPVQGTTILTLDATNEQISTAYESGKHVFINMFGLLNVQVQKEPEGSLYAIGFTPVTSGSFGVTKLGLYYLEAKESYWTLKITYITASTSSNS